MASCEAFNPFESALICVFDSFEANDLSYFNIMFNLSTLYMQITKQELTYMFQVNFCCGRQTSPQTRKS